MGSPRKTWGKRWFGEQSNEYGIERLWRAASAGRKRGALEVLRVLDGRTSREASVCKSS
jgi:hypothetical protein